jgi:hypothetical protein
MDWIHLAQDRDQWIAVVNTVIWTSEFCKMLENSCVDEQLTASQVGPNCM